MQTLLHADSFGWQVLRQEERGEQSIYSSCPASTALFGFEFSFAISSVSFSFFWLVGQPYLFPPQARDTSRSISALTGYLTVCQEKCVFTTTMSCTTFEKVTVLLKSNNFHMRNCKVEHTLKC